MRMRLTRPFTRWGEGRSVSRGAVRMRVRSASLRVAQSRRAGTGVYPGANLPDRERLSPCPRADKSGGLGELAEGAHLFPGWGSYLDSLLIGTAWVTTPPALPCCGPCPPLLSSDYSSKRGKVKAGERTEGPAAVAAWNRGRSRPAPRINAAATPPRRRGAGAGRRRVRGCSKSRRWRRPPER